jgi:hypothetical protein
MRGGEPEPPPPPPPPPPVVEVELPPEPEPIVLPALEASDGFLRAMIEGVSAHPRLGDVIAVDGIARVFVSAVVAIANGETPRALLLYLEPEERFAVAEREGKVVIDPATFERYTWITGVFSSLDATGTVELYADLEPLFDEAYGEIGYPVDDSKMRWMTLWEYLRRPRYQRGTWKFVEAMSCGNLVTPSSKI